ncbi:hypothetical protein EC991_000892 [Linnemannia zychae]|nr:hypothetical protein EC991_000892 [Linnemannia zychae]
MSELGMYFGIAVGCIALLSICGGIIYRKYRQDVKVKLAIEQEIQDRLQQVVDLNLPPFYDDHELDPVCIYEHELPPDVLPPVQPIFVHSSSDNSMLIPPEEDPLMAHNAAAREIQSPSIASTTNDHPAMLFSPAITVDNVETGGVESPLNATQAQEGYFAPVNMPTPPPAAAFFSEMQRPGTPSSVFSSSSIPTVPRSLNQEMINLARVRAPPSYDIPNVVVDRSPLYHPSTHSSSPYTPYTEDGHQFQDDYFGHVRIRAHTFSHPSSSSPNQAFLQQLQQQFHHQQEQHRQEQSEEETLPETPRYSLEFPSDVPHEHHLEQHQRSRALFDNNSVLLGGSPQSLQQSPASFSTISSWEYNEQENQLHGRVSPHSLSGSHTSSPLLAFDQTSSRRGVKPGLRARASTLGESSKALMQRMHSLLRHSTSAQSRDSTPASSPRLAPVSIEGGGVGSSTGAGMPMVGLGLDYGGSFESEQVTLAQDQEQGHEQVIVVVDEPEEDDSAVSVTSSTGVFTTTSIASAENGEYENTREQANDSDKEEEEEEGEEEKEEEQEKEVGVSKNLHQHTPQPTPSVESMATMPMPLAVS